MTNPSMAPMAIGPRPSIILHRYPAYPMHGSLCRRLNSRSSVLLYSLRPRYRISHVFGYHPARSPRIGGVLLLLFHVHDHLWISSSSGLTSAHDLNGLILIRDGQPGAWPVLP